MEVRLFGLVEPILAGDAPEAVQRTKGVARATTTKLIGRPGKVQSVMGRDTNARMAELRSVRWRRGVDAGSSLVR